MRPLPGRPIIRPGDAAEDARFHDMLDDFESDVAPLLGLDTAQRREVFVAQLIESQRRTRYIHTMRSHGLRESAFDPASGAFDPLKGAILRERAGDHDEACWLVLLSVHFGRHRHNGWDLSAQFYGRLGQGGVWDWTAAAADPDGIRDWLEGHHHTIRTNGGRFGNHRKYESLRGWTKTGSGAVLRSYVDWVGSSHAQRFAEEAHADATATERFTALYKSLAPVARFGRTACFDYLTMLGKLDLAEISPDSAHLVGATGPQQGARLLLVGSRTGSPTSKVLEAGLAPLRERLAVTWDVLEDALCNWQKSPSSFVSFRG